jgi:hypothetical protein
MTEKRGKTQEKLGKGQSLTLCQMLIELGASMCSAWCIQQKMDPTWLTQSIQSFNWLTMKELNVFTCADSPLRRSVSLIGMYTGQQLTHWPEKCILPSQTVVEKSPLECYLLQLISNITHFKQKSILWWSIYFWKPKWKTKATTWLYGQNVKINGYDESGTTALHFAASSSNVFAAGHFIEMGAKPNLFNNTGHSPLYLAAEISNTEMIYLIFWKFKRNVRTMTRLTV